MTMDKTTKQVNLINDLYIRWVSNTLAPEDDLLLIQYADCLEQIKDRADQQANSRMKQLNWKVAQMNLNKPNSERSN